MTLIYVFPGQGSQKKGMGSALFDRFPEHVEQADRILGYSIRKLCLDNPNDKLSQTQYTQPSLFVVNALTYLQRTAETGRQPDYAAGHSLGEYNALFAAGVFSFEQGIRLVKMRGELMSQARGGAMAAVIGLEEEAIQRALSNAGLTGVDLSNFNSPVQITISGPKEEIERAIDVLKNAGSRLVIPLNVSAAFHSRYMRDAERAFSTFLEQFDFSPPQIRVLSNYRAQPYEFEQIHENLTKQIARPVRWTETIQYLLKKPTPTFEEIGPGHVLTRLIDQISHSL
ncbi:MAG: ACP S-malonyltransferase [Waddliaceae bacterium]